MRKGKTYLIEVFINYMYLLIMYNVMFSSIYSTSWNLFSQSVTHRSQT